MWVFVIVKSMPSITFEENRVQWVAKRTELGRDPSTTSEDPHEKRLGQWQSDQRKYYKNKKLPEERIATLNATEWWVWESTPGKIYTKPNSFEENLVQWAAKRTELGRELSKTSKDADADEKRFGQWQSHQRDNYKNKKLSEERIAALEAIKEWAWESTPGKITSKHKSFEENRVQWAAFYKKFGRTPLTDADADEKRLAKWQSHQRGHYKKKTLSEERVKALNTTDGWVWSVETK
jgi:hypothetical protein